MEKNEKSSRRMVVSLVLAGLIWSCAPGFSATSKVPQTKRTALVFPDGKRIKGKSSNKVPASGKPHYEVIEWCQGAELIEANFSGPFNQGEGSGHTGPNSYSEAVVLSVTVFNGYNSSTVTPLTTKNLLTVRWIGGKENAPEPKKGLKIFFHHSSRTYVEAAGAGVKDIVGSASAKAEANTHGPVGSSNSGSEVYAPILGVDVNPRADLSTFVLENVYSGWKGYLSTTATATANSRIFGSAEAEAEAEITWEAEIKGGQ